MSHASLALSSEFIAGLFDPATPLGAVLDGAGAILLAAAVMAGVHFLRKLRPGDEQPPAPPASGEDIPRPPTPAPAPVNGVEIDVTPDGGLRYRKHNGNSDSTPAKA